MTDDASRFTGKERDTETGLDYFGARYMSSAQGRFTSPDPIVVTKERLRDPQSLNLYAYTRNNPLRFVFAARTPKSIGSHITRPPMALPHTVPGLFEPSTGPDMDGTVL